MSWEYRQPVKIVFGSGKLSYLAECADNASRPIIVSSNFFQRTGQLKEILGGRSYDLFTEVSPNPDVTEVNRCSEQIRSNGNDLIIAIGGGSVMDLAKAASIVADDISAFHGTDKPLPQEGLPLIAVPTTAGTGSEVTNVAVLTNRKTGRKAPLASDVFFPRLAIIDPELTCTMPPPLTASTGIDVLCHAVEGYWSRNHQPICDALALQAAKNVFSYLPRAYHHPDDKEAREKMCEASLIAGLSFSLPKTTAVHACSFPLTNIYGIPHGEACGLALDFFVRINAADTRTRALAESLGFPAVDDFADAIAALKKEIGLRTDLAEFSLTDTDTERLVQGSHHPNLLNNPVEIGDDVLRRLYGGLRCRTL